MTRAATSSMPHMVVFPRCVMTAVLSFQFIGRCMGDWLIHACFPMAAGIFALKLCFDEEAEIVNRKETYFVRVTVAPGPAKVRAASLVHSNFEISARAT